MQPASDLLFNYAHIRGRRRMINCSGLTGDRKSRIYERSVQHDTLPPKQDCSLDQKCWVVTSFESQLNRQSVQSRKINQLNKKKGKTHSNSYFSRVIYQCLCVRNKQCWFFCMYVNEMILLFDPWVNKQIFNLAPQLKQNYNRGPEPKWLDFFNMIWQTCLCLYETQRVW